VRRREGRGEAFVEEGDEEEEVAERERAYL